jgi:hypothetical protein
MKHRPHVHMIVPGGGISRDGSRGIAKRPDFFLPVRVLAKLFRRLMIEKLVDGDVAPRLEHRHFPRRHQGSGFACITAVRERSFGGIHFGNTFGWRARLDGYMMDFYKKSPFGLPLPV